MDEWREEARHLSREDLELQLESLNNLLAQFSPTAAGGQPIVPKEHIAMVSDKRDIFQEALDTLVVEVERVDQIKQQDPPQQMEKRGRMHAEAKHAVEDQVKEEQHIKERYAEQKHDGREDEEKEVDSWMYQVQMGKMHGNKVQRATSLRAANGYIRQSPIKSGKSKSVKSSSTPPQNSNVDSGKPTGRTSTSPVEVPSVLPSAASEHTKKPSTSASASASVSASASMNDYDTRPVSFLDMDVKVVPLNTYTTDWAELLPTSGILHADPKKWD